MKKKMMSILAAALTVGLLAGCGSENAENPASTGTGDEVAAENTTVLKDLDVDKYVTLGEYKGLQVSVPAAAVDEAELESMMSEIYFSYVTAENGGIVDRAVEVGDTVNIDYVGKKDDVAFDGGTAAGQSLTIGSGQFIDGFEDGLVGVMPGTTVDLNLTFPEGYHSADLAGQAVVFTVTVNFIVPTEMDDAVIAGMGIENVTNEAELRQYANDYLYENALYNYEVNVQNAVMNAFMQNCTFTEVPANLVTKYEEASRTNITATAESYGVDADTFTNYFYQMDMETFIDAYSEDAVMQDIAMQSVANKEGLNITDEELDAMLLEQAQAVGMTTIEEYLGQNSKEDYREYFMYDKVLGYLVENAVVAE